MSMSTAVAIINGRCSGIYNDESCICLDHTACTQTWHGEAIPGSPGNWPCPHDAGNVWGCKIRNHCPHKDDSTLCVWKEKCSGKILRGKLALELQNEHSVYESTNYLFLDPVCPGGSDYVCCDFY